MELSPILLSKLLFYSFIFGLALGALNDVFRITRVFFGVRYSNKHFLKLYSALKLREETGKKKRGVLLNTLICLQDILFMACAGFGIVILNYYLNDGEIRFFTVFSMVIGIVLWYMSIGKVIIFFSEPIVVILKFATFTMLRILSAPIRYFIRFCRKTYKKISHKVRKSIANNRNMRYNKRKEKYYGDLSCFGFFGKDIMKGKNKANEA